MKMNKFQSVFRQLSIGNGYRFLYAIFGAELPVLAAPAK